MWATEYSGTWGWLLHTYRLLVARQLLCSSIAKVWFSHHSVAGMPAA